MSFFAHALLRLKEQLGVQSDKEVAALLEMSPTAFADRKKRDAFPEDKLFAYAAKHPERDLDVAYVLTGTPAKIHAVMAGVKEAADLASKQGGTPEQRNDRLWAIHDSIQANQTTLGEVHQAVLDAVHYLSLGNKIDAEQLASAVTKFCARQTNLPAAPMNQQNVMGGAAQQFNGTIKGGVAQRDIVHKGKPKKE